MTGAFLKAYLVKYDMSLIFKVAKPGINALTNNDPDNFSLFVDQKENNTLIKEKVHDTVDVSNGSFKRIQHGLRYAPLTFVFCETSSGVFKRVVGNAFDNIGFHVTNEYVHIFNASGSLKTFKYFIFYDLIP